jgi:hypothetical protein
MEDFANFLVLAWMVLDIWTSEFEVLRSLGQVGGVQNLGSYYVSY